MVKIDHVSSDHTENRKHKVIQHFSGQNSGLKSTNFPTLFTTKETIAWTVQLSWPALETRRLRLTDQGRLGLLNRRNGSIVTISAKNSNDSQNAYNNNVLVGWRMLLFRIAELSAFKMLLRFKQFKWINKYWHSLENLSLSIRKFNIFWCNCLKTFSKIYRKDKLTKKLTIIG